MAKATIPGLRERHPGRHWFCDRCGCGLSYETGYVRSSNETPAGSFAYSLCRGCCDEIDSKRKPQRERAYREAMVNHAAHYSWEFGCFVAAWYGLPAPAKPMELAA